MKTLKTLFAAGAAVVLFLATSVAQAAADAYYVNAATGLDDGTYDGRSVATPFKTITKALTAAVDGETILVAEGTYKEGTFTEGKYKYPNLSVTDGRHLTLRATGACDNTIIDAEGQSSCLWLNTTYSVNTNVVIEGFTLRNGQASWRIYAGAFGGGAYGGWLKNCRILSCHSEVNGGGAMYAKLEDCVIEGCSSEGDGGGLYECEANRCRIVGNVISNVDSSVCGAGVYGGSTANSLIAYNLIDATCTKDGSGAGAARGAQLVNCTVYANTNSAATSYGGGVDLYGYPKQIRNTIVFGNVSGGEPSEINLAGKEYASYFFNCCTNDPSFKNAAGGDFGLCPTSVCHNAGNNAYVSGELDLAGAARIQEGMVDIGAFEYAPIMTITAEPTPATAGMPYAYTLTQTGGAEPVAWSIDASEPTLSIPVGLTVSGKQLVGTMTKGGSYLFNVTATEAGGETQKKVVSLDVLSNYTLHFDGNGNKTGSAPACTNLTSVEEYVLPEPGMACGCARFLGWATNATAAATYQPGDKVKCLTSEDGATFTLYATWEEVFVLEFANNASGAVGQHVFYTNAIGKTFTIYRNAGATTNIVDYGSGKIYLPYRIGWQIDNWNMSPDGTGTAFLRNATLSQYSQSVSSTDFGANRGDVITLHAQWYESAWDFYTLDPQLNGGKWQIRVCGDEYAELSGVSGEVSWSDSITLPASYGGRTIVSLANTFQYMYHEVQTNLKHITIPEGYTNLCNYAFRCLSALESIRFPSTLKVIPKGCCVDCDQLTTVLFAEGNCRIGEDAFNSCDSLPSIILPRGLTNVEFAAFYSCTNLSTFVLSPDYIGSSDAGYVLYNCPVGKLEIPASCAGFGYYSLNKVAALLFLGDRPTWDVNNANRGTATLIEFPATNTTWNAGKIDNYLKVPHKGFVGPIAAFGVTDAYFWTNANETVTFAYAESPLAATVTIPAGVISWGGVDWEIVGFEADAFAGQATTTVYYPISDYAKWEQVTPPAGITLAPIPGTYFTLTFHTNGGDPYPSMTFPPSATRALPSAKPTKSGFKFLGWATTSDGSPAYQAGDDYTAGAAGASATLYAKWEEVGTYAIRFNGNSAYATGVPADIVAAVGTTPTIPAGPSREGWTFSGWTNAVNDTVYQPGDTFDEGCEKDDVFTLYAKWTETTIDNLSYTDDDKTVWGYDRTGDAVKVKSVTPGPDVEELELPSAIKGSKTVTKASGFELPEKINGLWWNYEALANNCAKLKSTTLSGPTDLVLPSEIGGRTVTDFATAYYDGLVNNRDYITSVEIPGTVKTIPFGAFERCDNLIKVTLHEGTEKMLDNAFSYDNAITTPIDFPSTLTNVSAYAFQQALRKLPFDADGIRYADKGKTYLLEAHDDVDHAPEGVKVFAYPGFSETTCEKITLPSTAITYSSSLFRKAEALREVVFKSAATVYGHVFNEQTTITNITLLGGGQIFSASSYVSVCTSIKRVNFLTTPPSWSIADNLPGVNTIGYYANYADDWAPYKTAHPSYTYIELCSAETTGLYLKYDLVEDLGIVIDADYLAGDKVTLKVEGLAKGLKLVTTPVYVDPTAKKKVIKDYTYTIEGVPTESVDFATQPMYARVIVTYKDKAKGKVETLQPLVLSIVAPEPEELVAGVFNENYGPIDIAALWPAVADAKAHPKDWTFKTWPAGIKYNATAKPITTKNKDKSVTTNAMPYEVYGKPTKAGVYPITATHKHKLADGKTTVSETYSAVMTVWGDDGAMDFRYVDQAYVATETKTLTGVTGVSGQPTGIKFEKNTGKLSGTPTKPGVYATTVTYSDKTKKTFLWKVTEGKNEGFLGTMDWTVENSAVTVMQGVIQDAWTCKLPADAKVTASTLPSGLKLAQDKATKKWTISGTPTKAGNYVVTFKTVRNGVTVTERLSFVIEPNQWTGTWYGVQYDEQDASLMAEVTVSANGTVKFVFTEGTTNYNAKGVVSQVTKTAVTVKNLDASGKTATLPLPRNKKDPLSVDRTCVLDFDRNRVKVDGVRVMSLHEKLTTDEYDDGYWSDVTTIVAEEVLGAETNAYAYVTVTFDAKKRSFKLQGKLWDGTAVNATASMIPSDAGPATSPILVIDKMKNAVMMMFASDDRGHLCASIVENGKGVSIGRWGFEPWFGQFLASQLKSKKFNQLTKHDQLVILDPDSADVLVSSASGKEVTSKIDAVGTTASTEIVLDIPQKSLATAVSAQGLVKFTITDADGWKWVCELLPVGEGGDGPVPFRGIATGTKAKQPTRYCPVWTK